MRPTRPLLAATLLLASSTLAQPAGLPSFELERLELNPSGQGSLVLGTGELLPEGGFRLSLTGQYENDPLVFYRDGSRVGSVVGDRVTAHLLGAWAPTHWLELGVHLPVVAWQRGDDLRGEGFQAPGRTGLATPSVSARLGLLSQRRAAPVDLALELGAGLPLGSADTLSRDSLPRFSPRVMVGRSFGWLRAGVEAGALVRPSVILSEDEDIQDELGSEVRLGAVLATTGEGLRGELSVRGALPLTREPKSLEVLAGLRLPVGESLEAYALGGPGFGDMPGTPTFRLLLGVAFRGGGAVKPAPVVEQTVVAPVVEQAVAVASPAVEQAVAPVPPDLDGDGLGNGVDRCPTEAGLVELRGCPARDTDGDSVADHLDNCPGETGVASNQGCPVQQQQLVAIQTDKLAIKESVYFATGKSRIQPRSFKLLDQVARVLTRHPQIERMVIEGHTDDRGEAESNRALSLARAEAVKHYLVSQGVEVSRLEARGFGPDRPLESNQTARGRAANRRVDFILVPPERAQR